MEIVKKVFLFGAGVMTIAFDEVTKTVDEVIKTMEKQGEQLNGHYKKVEEKIVSIPRVSKS